MSKKRAAPKDNISSEIWALFGKNRDSYVGRDIMSDDEDMEALKEAYGTGPASGDSVAPVQEGLEAKSIKCTECGKIFKNAALANFHAEKSGHDQFEESTEEVYVIDT